MNNVELGEYVDSLDLEGLRKFCVKQQLELATSKEIVSLLEQKLENVVAMLRTRTRAEFGKIDGRFAAVSVPMGLEEAVDYVIGYLEEGSCDVEGIKVRGVVDCQTLETWGTKKPNQEAYERAKAEHKAEVDADESAEERWQAACEVQRKHNATLPIRSADEEMRFQLEKPEFGPG